ncbi:MAG: GntR family transcriptional regulator [Acidobacteriota bacterium]
MQLYEALKRKIETGEWAVGSQIPTEGGLCEMFNVSRATVRAAMQDLARQGYLTRRQGKGTFVQRRTASEGLPVHTSFQELMLEDAAKCAVTLLARTVMMPVDGLDAELGIAPDRHVIYIRRLWAMANEPVIQQEAYIPYQACPALLEAEISGEPLVSILERKHGIRITRVRTRLDAVPAGPADRKAMKVHEGSPLLVLLQHFYSGDTAVAYARSIKPARKQSLLLDFERESA